MITSTVSCIGKRLVGDKVAISFRFAAESAGPGPSPMMGGEFTREVTPAAALSFELGESYDLTIE